LEYNLQHYDNFIDKSVLSENRPPLKFTPNYTQDSGGIFSISSPRRISKTFPTFTLFFVEKQVWLYYEKKITPKLEDMNYIF